VRLEGLGKLKCSDLIGNRTRDLPACNIVPQPTTLPRDLPAEYTCSFHVVLTVNSDFSAIQLFLLLFLLGLLY
jgi:hypothetical protein